MIMFASCTIIDITQYSRIRFLFKIFGFKEENMPSVSIVLP